MLWSLTSATHGQTKEDQAVSGGGAAPDRAAGGGGKPEGVGPLHSPNSSRRLEGAHEIEHGTLFTCPCCNGEGKLLVQTNRSNAPNYIYSLSKLCGCDDKQILAAMKELNHNALVASRRRWVGVT